MFCVQADVLLTPTRKVHVLPIGNSMHWERFLYVILLCTSSTLAGSGKGPLTINEEEKISHHVVLTLYLELLIIIN
jgi:hypothetical protein